MSQGSAIYGQRPAKKRRHNELPNSLDFAAQLTSHIAASGSSRERARPSHRSTPLPTTTITTTTATTATTPWTQLQRPSSTRAKPARPAKPAKPGQARLHLKDVAASGPGGDAASLAHQLRRLEEKARIYDAMRNDDDFPPGREQDSLVDFDRKWAEEGGRAEESDDERGEKAGSGSGGAEDQTIEFEDEFGRTHRGTAADRERMERRLRRGALGAEELGRMSARPSAPEALIRGDVIQTFAFSPQNEAKMEELARDRDRGPTPPPETHYNADAEVRTKGVGFYKFSTEQEVRAVEMESLHSMRLETDTYRQERRDELAARRREIGQRKKQLEARRAQKMADSFLSGLVPAMPATGPEPTEKDQAGAGEEHVVAMVADEARSSSRAGPGLDG